MPISIYTSISSQQIVLSKLFQADYRRLGGRETWERKAKQTKIRHGFHLIAYHGLERWQYSRILVNLLTWKETCKRITSFNMNATWTGTSWLLDYTSLKGLVPGLMSSLLKTWTLCVSPKAFVGQNKDRSFLIGVEGIEKNLMGKWYATIVPFRFVKKSIPNMVFPKSTQRALIRTDPSSPHLH